MYRMLYVLNLLFTIICTIAAVTIYGLMLLPFLGAYQIILSIIFFFKWKEFTLTLKINHLVHFSCSLILLISIPFIMEYLSFHYLHRLFLLSSISGILAYYHVWITWRLDLLEEKNLVAINSDFDLKKAIIN